MKSSSWTGGQYSLVRIGMALLAAVGISEWDRVAWLPWFWGGLGIMLALGWMQRLAAWSLAILWVWALVSKDGFEGAVLWLMPLMLMAHAMQPRAPYGSLSSWGRLDPRGSWTFHARIKIGLWLALALAYLLGPLVEGWNPLPSYEGWLPIWGWQIVVVQLLFVPMVISSRLRPWAWLTLFIAQIACLVLGTLVEPDLNPDPLGRLVMLLLHFFTLDPAWIPARRVAPGTTLFFDGECGLCHGFVRFVLAEDQTAQFRFTPIQSNAFESEIGMTEDHSHGKPSVNLDALRNTVVLRSADGIFIRSSAALRILAGLGGLWRVVAALLWMIPLPVRDLLYRGLARIRRHLFPRPQTLCPLMPEELSVRFRD